MQIFQRSAFRTQCDECQQEFPVNTGGVCDHCRRILCNRHLHGSFLRRIAISFGAPYRCVSCRAGRGPSPA